jgi:hypothetical protein
LRTFEMIVLFFIVIGMCLDLRHNQDCGCKASIPRNGCETCRPEQVLRSYGMAAVLVVHCRTCASLVPAYKTHVPPDYNILVYVCIHDFWPLLKTRFKTGESSER